MSSLKISIHGYQVLEDCQLEAVGLTIIRGDSNHGKSSIIRSIEDSFFNASGSDFINDTKDSCTVSLEFPHEDGKPDLSFSWTKPRKGSMCYVINGNTITKLGRNGKIPQLEEAGIKETTVRDRKVRLFFWKPTIELSFLVRETPSFIFDFVSSVMSEKKIIPVLKTMSVDTKELEKDMILLEGAIQSHKENIISLKKKEKVLSDISKIESDIINIRQRRVALDRWETTISEADEIDQTLLELIRNSEKLDNLMLRIPSFTDVVTKASMLESLSSIETNLISADYNIEKINSRLEYLSDLEPLKEQVSSLPTLLDNLKGLSESLRSIEDVELKLSVANKTYVTALADYDTSSANFNVYKNEIGFCPTCNKSLVEV